MQGNIYSWTLTYSLFTEQSGANCKTIRVIFADIALISTETHESTFQKLPSFFSTDSFVCWKLIDQRRVQFQRGLTLFRYIALFNHVIHSLRQISRYLLTHYRHVTLSWPLHVLPLCNLGRVHPLIRTIREHVSVCCQLPEKLADCRDFRHLIKTRKHQLLVCSS
jgi:hypothetical protein